MSLRDNDNLEESGQLIQDGPNVKRLAFGEWKTLKQWSQDSRCTVAYATLWNRIRHGVSLEKSIAGGLCRRGDFYEGFGERKTLHEWASDPRSLVTQTALKQRLKRGEALETALTRPIDPNRPRAGHIPATWSGFGETKTFSQWFNDQRCTISRSALRDRLNAGVLIEDALVARPFQLVSKKVSAFGERKVAEEWSKDPRCKVSLIVLLRRLRMGMDPELALANPSVGEAFLRLRSWKRAFEMAGRYRRS